MAPLKFEEHLKEKLEGREIAPSSKAWSKIAAGLESQPIKQKSKKPAYFAIAACLIGLLIASVWFFNTAQTDVNTPQVVDVDKINSKKESILKANTSLKEQNATIVTSKEENKNLIKEVVTKQNSKLTIKENPLKQNTEVAVQQNNTKELKLAEPEKKLIDAKLNVVIEKLALLEENNVAVTDAEVDSLLRNAQQEILAEKAINAGISIDAMALLIEAENELDVSFRDKIFDNLKQRYLKLKTAVAARAN
ncbi:hypothetical protein [Cellulophaga omnivescoria]|uniref:hypothetical protein n=1 Tax=Cellulophaga omnivescoria TaxID=1888890 RepID=UPI0009851E59|nr:hypothetical protein [Cellulophaga omnivescoria]WKB80168.1 hypothetical protein QYR09_10440 [Cellulophaga lytica]